MYTFLNSAHSGLRWLVLLSILSALIFSLINIKKSGIEKPQKMAYLFSLVFCHIQLLIGIVLYFISPKVNFENTFSNPASRFFTVEHTIGMLLAIALITIGYSKSKKSQRHKTIFIFYLFAFVIILASIPWPFRTELGVVDWF